MKVGDRVVIHSAPPGAEAYYNVKGTVEGFGGSHLVMMRINNGGTVFIHERHLKIMDMYNE